MKKLYFILLAALMGGTVTAQTMSVSVLGDSYSTYEDFVTPATNELWYYAKNREAKTDEVKSDLYYHRAKTICEMFGGSVYLEQALSDAYAAESLDSRNIVVLELISRLEAENGNQEKAKQYQEKFEQKLTEQAEVGGGKG